MAPNFQSSFIPKGPETSQAFQKRKTSVLGILVVTLFVGVLLLSGGLIFYKNMINTDIENIKSELAVAGSSIDKETIDQMVKYSQKLDVVKSIVLKHQVASGFMKSLASSTVSTVSFSEFYYNGTNAGGLSVRMRGKTNSYGGVALQEDVFLKNKYWKSVNFSNLTLGEDGAVSFELEVLVDPEIAIYGADLVAVPTEETTELGAGNELDGIDDINLDLDNIGI